MKTAIENLALAALIGINMVVWGGIIFLMTHTEFIADLIVLSIFGRTASK